MELKTYFLILVSLLSYIFVDGVYASSSSSAPLSKQLQEKASTLPQDALKQMNYSPRPIVKDPVQALKSQKRLAVEGCVLHLPCLQDIRVKKQQLRESVTEIILNESEEKILNHTCKLGKSSDEDRAHCLAKSVVKAIGVPASSEDTNFNHSKYMHDFKYTLKQELNRFIIPVPSHDQASLSSVVVSLPPHVHNMSSDDSSSGKKMSGKQTQGVAADFQRPATPRLAWYDEQEVDDDENEDENKKCGCLNCLLRS